VAYPTNIGWMLFFPKAGVIVTDISAPLSHAALAAREPGIPAVINCGDAILRLRTDGHVRVDRSQGVVKIVENEEGV